MYKIRHLKRYRLLFLKLRIIAKMLVFIIVFQRINIFRNHFHVVSKNYPNLLAKKQLNKIKQSYSRILFQHHSEIIYISHKHSFRWMLHSRSRVYWCYINAIAGRRYVILSAMRRHRHWRRCRCRRLCRCRRCRRWSRRDWYLS